MRNSETLIYSECRTYSVGEIAPLHAIVCEQTPIQEFFDIEPVFFF